MVAESESPTVVHPAAASSSDAGPKEVKTSAAKDVVLSSSHDATSTAIADQKVMSPKLVSCLHNDGS